MSNHEKHFRVVNKEKYYLRLFFLASFSPTSPRSRSKRRSGKVLNHFSLRSSFRELRLTRAAFISTFFHPRATRRDPNFFFHHSACASVALVALRGKTESSLRELKKWPLCCVVELQQSRSDVRRVINERQMRPSACMCCSSLAGFFLCNLESQP
jgi:hypothetical protein